MPDTERKNLRNEIRSVIAARKPPRKDAVDEAGTIATPATTTSIPALPAVPALPTGNTELRRDGVTSPNTNPPSSEHPALTASA